MWCWLKEYDREKNFMVSKATGSLLGTFLLAVFCVTQADAQTEHILRRFLGAAKDGASPQAALIADAAGNLYGTTVYGGKANLGGVCAVQSLDVGCGTVFEISPPAEPGGRWTETILYEFVDGNDGALPSGPLVMDETGSLYGETQYSGAQSAYGGTVFELSPPTIPGGRWTETTLHSFGASGDGTYPLGGLVLDTQGNLFGTTNGGGSGKCGTAFELTPSQGTWAETIIFDFQGSGGCAPTSGLVTSDFVNFYGTTGGGDPDDNSVYRLSQATDAWKLVTLYDFSDDDSTTPQGPLAISKGALYGTTVYGGGTACGGQGCGTVYQYSFANGFKVVHRFLVDSTDGIYPQAVTADESGNLYVTTLGGGGNPECVDNVNGCGAIVELTPPGEQGGPWVNTTLYGFSGFNGDGASPVGAVLLKRGAILGTTAYGGDDYCGIGSNEGCGTVFALTK
jgi:uncharacterized repeat protein (TIGR03803 family)